MNRSTRRASFGVAGVVAAVLIVASTAWACTQLMGQMTLNPLKGKPGRSVAVTAAGLSNGATTTYRLQFQDAPATAAGGMCHDSPIILREGIPTTNGAFSTSVITPKPTPRGKAKICGTDEQNGYYGTLHKTFTVL